jgi:hypothetical protein
MFPLATGQQVNLLEHVECIERLILGLTDPRQRQIGIVNRENMEELLDSHAIWPFTARLGWRTEQVGWLTQEARQEMQDGSLKLYIPL